MEKGEGKKELATFGLGILGENGENGINRENGENWGNGENGENGENRENRENGGNGENRGKRRKWGKRGKWGKWRKWSKVKCSLSAAGAKAAVRSNFGCRLSRVGKSHSINLIGVFFVCYLEATLRCYLHL